MALAHSPSVATTGLVLVYDMNNTGRSWKGAPTTNLVPYPYADWNGSNFVFGNYIYDATGTQTFTYVTDVSNPIGSPAVMQYTTGTTGYKYWAVQGTIATTGTHTFSYYARIVSGPAATSNLSNSQLWRSNGVDQAVTGDWNPTYTTNWVRYSTTGPCTAGTVLDYFPIHSGGLTGGYTIQYCGFQLELGTYATPFVNGTRSNTQALLDPTGQNTLTATSLTYASNNTFSFNGTDGTITSPNSSALQVGATFTLNTWINASSLAARHGVFSTRTANDAGSWQLEVGTANSGAGRIAITGIGTFIWESSSNVIATNIWYNICVVKANNAEQGASVYLNGVLLTPGATTAYTILDNNNAKAVGQGTSSTQFFSGSISSVSLYNRALSANEVMQNFNAFRGRYGV